MGMSWQRIQETGFGSLEFRVKVSGLDYEFCSHPEMVRDATDETGTATGGTVYRRSGLLRDGLTISEEAILPENRIELGGNSFRIVDDWDYSATKAFYRRSRKSVQLLGETLSPEATTLLVTTGGTWKVGEYAWIGSECIRIVSFHLLGGFAEWTVQRGKLGTIPQKHFSRTDMGAVLRPTIQDCPYGIENHRITLYAYGDGDDLQGDGTIVWRGIVTEEAGSEDGLAWRFEGGPLTEVLKGEIGTTFEDIKFRGLYWSKRQWICEFQRLDGPRVSAFGFTGDASNPILPIIAVTASGFYPDKWTLASELNNQLVSASRSQWSDSNGMGCTVIDGEVAFIYTTTGTPSGVIGNVVQGINQIGTFAVGGEVRSDRTGEFLLEPYQKLQEFPQRLVSVAEPYGGELNYRFAESGRLGTVVAPNSTYAIRTEAPIPDILAPFYSGESPIGSTRDPQLLHVDASGLPDSVNDVRVYKANSEDGDTGTGGPSRDDDIEVSRLYGAVGPSPVMVNESNQTIKAPLFGSFNATNEDHYMILGTNFVRAGHVVNFLEALVKQSPSLSNQGFCPLIGPDDFDLADMATVISGVGLNLFTGRRDYTFYKKGKKLEEVLAAEFKLIGCYPSLTADGKITIRPFRQLSGMERIDHSLTADDILTDDSFPPLVSNKYGIWNSVSLKTRYEPQSDEYKGAEVIVSNIDSISQNSGKRKTIEIEPVSFESYSGVELRDIVSDILWRETGLLAFKYYVTALEVPLTYLSSSIGDSVHISSRQLPNYSQNSRRRGTGLAGGIIVGRRFDLDQGRGQLTILLSSEDVSGDLYTPNLASYAADIPAPTGSIVGTTVTINVNPADKARIFGNRDAIGDHFRVGDRVILTETDTETPEGSGVGTIISVDGLDINMAFADASEVPAGLFSDQNWKLEFASLSRTTGSISASLSQSMYSIIDSGSIEAATGGGGIEGYPAGNHFFKVSF